MQLQDMLYSQGFGVRRVCSGLVQQGWVQLWDDATGQWLETTDSTLEIEPEGLRFKVQGVEWQYHALGYVLLKRIAPWPCFAVHAIRVHGMNGNNVPKAEIHWVVAGGWLS